MDFLVSRCVAMRGSAWFMIVYEATYGGVRCHARHLTSLSDFDRRAAGVVCTSLKLSK